LNEQQTLKEIFSPKKTVPFETMPRISPPLTDFAIELNAFLKEACPA
jgi:hypothetical protein